MERKDRTKSWDITERISKQVASSYSESLPAKELRRKKKLVRFAGLTVAIKHVAEKKAFSPPMFPLSYKTSPVVCGVQSMAARKIVVLTRVGRITGVKMVQF